MIEAKPAYKISHRLACLINEYERLRKIRDELQTAKTLVEEEFKKIQSQMAEQMVQDDVPRQRYGSFIYSPKLTRHYNFKPAYALHPHLRDRFAVLSRNGFTVPIKRVIDQKAFDAQIEDCMKRSADGRLPREVEQIINVYDEFRIRRTIDRSGLMNGSESLIERVQGGT